MIALLSLPAVFRGDRKPQAEPPRESFSQAETTRVRVTEEEAALSVLGEIRKQLREIEEMREVIPAKKKRERRAIAERLTTCLKRLSELELKVKLRPGSSRRGESGAGKRNV